MGIGIDLGGTKTEAILLSPTRHEIGGGLSNIELLYERVPDLWHPYIFSDQVGALLKRNHQGDLDGLRGAAWLWEIEKSWT